MYSQVRSIKVRKGSYYVRWIQTWGSFVFLILIWQIAGTMGLLNLLIFPTPIHIVGEMIRGLFAPPYLLAQSMGSTLFRLVIASVIGMSIGTIIGAIAASNQYISTVLDQIVSMLMVIPPVITIPVIVLWLGNGSSTVIFTASIASALPAYVGAESGMREIDKKLFWITQSMMLSAFGKFTKVILPGSLTRLIPAYRISLGYAWRSTIAAEILTLAAPGLGVLDFEGNQFGDYTITYGAIILIAVMGIVINNIIFSSVERFTLKKWGVMS